MVDLIGLWPAKTEHFSGKFYELTWTEATTNLVELLHIKTKSIDAIAKKFDKPGYPGIPDKHKLSMIMVMCSWEILLSASVVLQESNMFPQPVKANNLVFQRKHVWKWQSYWKHCCSHDCPKHHETSSISLMMDLSLQCIQWDPLSLQYQSKSRCPYVFLWHAPQGPPYCKMANHYPQ